MCCVQSAAEARSFFEDAPGVTVVEIPINDGWARDWGPSVSAFSLKAPSHRRLVQILAEA